MSPAMAIVKELTEKHEKRIAELEAALRNLVDHYIALADGPRQHSLGCQCGASDDGKHSCFTLSEAFADAKRLVQ